MWKFERCYIISEWRNICFCRIYFLLDLWFMLLVWAHLNSKVVEILAEYPFSSFISSQASKRPTARALHFFISLEVPWCSAKCENSSAATLFPSGENHRWNSLEIMHGSLLAGDLVWSSCFCRMYDFMFLPNLCVSGKDFKAQIWYTHKSGFMFFWQIYFDRQALADRNERWISAFAGFMFFLVPVRIFRSASACRSEWTQDLCCCRTWISTE